MKRIFILFFLLLFVGISYAGDNYDQTTRTQFSTDGKTYRVVKIGPFTMTDSTGNYYSKPIHLGSWNTEDGYIQIQHTNVTGTEDIDVTFQYGYSSQNTGGTWTTASADDELTQLTGGTTVNDTTGIIDGVNDINFHNSLYLRVKFDGQAGNPQTTVTAYLWFNETN